MAPMCVRDLSTTGPNAQERTGLQPGQSVSTQFLLLGNSENIFELLDLEPASIHTAEIALKMTPKPSRLPGGFSDIDH